MKTIIIGGFIVTLFETFISLALAFGYRETAAMYFLIATGITAGLLIILMIVYKVVMLIKSRKRL